MVCQKLLSKDAWKRAKEIASLVVFERFEDQQDIKQLTLGWFSRAQASRNCQYPDCFEAFGALWQAFNGWAQLIANRERDREWIDALTLNCALQDEFAQLLECDNHFASLASTFRNQWPIFRASEIHNAGIPWETGPRQEIVQYYLDHDMKQFEPRCWTEHTNKGEDVPLDWPHTLAALYRVRNNLMHGEKAQTQMNHDIVSSAFQVLLCLLEESGYFG